MDNCSIPLMTAVSSAIIENQEASFNSCVITDFNAADIDSNISFWVL